MDNHNCKYPNRIHEEMFDCGHMHMVKDKDRHHHDRHEHRHHIHNHNSHTCTCRDDVINSNKKTYKELFEPNVISSIEFTVISRFKIVINYSDQSTKSSTIDIGDRVAVSFIKNGKIYQDIIANVTRIIKTEPNMTIELDSSSEYDSKKFILPVTSIRDISNLSHPENDEYTPIGELTTDEMEDINDIIDDIWEDDNVDDENTNNSGDTTETDEAVTNDILSQIWE